MSMNAEQLIDTYLCEKPKKSIVKGPFLSGKQVAALSDKQHIFIDGKHAVVVSVDVSVKSKKSELVYVKGRKAFGREQYMDVPYNDMKTNIQAGVPNPDSE